MNVKPGDLAIIVKAMVPDNIGKIVRVVKFLKEDPRFGVMWVIECDRVKTVVGTEKLDVRPVDSGRNLCGVDDWMRPVSGLPDDERIPARTDLPEAFKLALGIEMRSWV